MTKADISQKVAEKTGFTKQYSSELVETVLSIMKNTLEEGEKVKIAGFGNFEVRQKKDRVGRNPQTAESIIITARRVLTFKPSNVLKSSVNK